MGINLLEKERFIAGGGKVKQYDLILYDAQGNNSIQRRRQGRIDVNSGG
jgi:hypothetical protein